MAAVDAGRGEARIVGDLMSKVPITLSPGDRVGDAVVAFVDNWINGAPVVDAEGRLVGILTDGDLVRALAVQLGTAIDDEGWDLAELLAEADEDMATRMFELASRPVGELMTTDVIAIEDDAPVARATRLMTENMLRRLPVVRDGKVVGVITRSDLVLGILARYSLELFRDR